MGERLQQGGPIWEWDGRGHRRGDSSEDPVRRGRGGGLLRGAPPVEVRQRGDTADVLGSIALMAS